MSRIESIRQRVDRCVRKFASSAGHDAAKLDDQTDLAGGLGLSSDEGLDLVLDLCEEFHFDFPRDFNPVVHDTGKRGRRLGELVHKVEEMLSGKEVTYGTS
jgi:acyl carrier protein